jgi:hypothetical protein
VVAQGLAIQASFTEDSDQQSAIDSISNSGFNPETTPALNRSADFPQTSSLNPSLNDLAEQLPIPSIVDRRYRHLPELEPKAEPTDRSSAPVDPMTALSLEPELLPTAKPSRLRDSESNSKRILLPLQPLPTASPRSDSDSSAVNPSESIVTKTQFIDRLLIHADVLNSVISNSQLSQQSEPLSPSVPLSNPAPVKTEMLLSPAEQAGLVQEKRQSLDSSMLIPKPVAKPPLHVIQPAIGQASLPPAQPTFTAEPAPIIQVTIGRIEVRATPPLSHPRSQPRSEPTVMGLDDYLRQRAKGASP